MGISRDSFHKRRKTGGKLTKWKMNRKYELGRQSSNTKIGHPARIRTVRTRGGNKKYRALRLDTGNFSWASESVTRKVRVLNVVYNSTNNELVRTNTLVKGGIVQIDGAAFKQWYEQHYGVKIGKKKDTDVEIKRSNHVQRKLEKRQATRVLAKEIEQQFNTGRIYACISSRPGQSGRCDGYILEGPELKFYLSKMSKKQGNGPGIMHIYVRDLEGVTHSVYCEESEPETVADLKDQIESLTGVPAEDQRLNYGVESLDDDSLVRDVLQEEATVFLTCGLDGGAKKRKKKVYTKPKKVPHKHKKVKLAVLKFYKVDGNNKVVRLRKESPVCGPGVFMATHFNRYHCGKSGVTYLHDKSGEGK